MMFTPPPLSAEARARMERATADCPEAREVFAALEHMMANPAAPETLAALREALIDAVPGARITLIDEPTAARQMRRGKRRGA